MFTGIVQSVGVVRSVRRGPAGARLVLDAPRLPRPLPLGSSVCVSGACLTVAICDDSSTEFDVIPETLERTTLGELAVGRRVNLERSLRIGDGLDGHMVQGHIDGIARVRGIERDGARGYRIALAADAGLMTYMIPKGSVAIDGVSLTIADVTGDTFSVALIPTTLAETTLGDLAVGDAVNIETDILVRTVIAHLQRLGGAGPRGERLTLEMLREQGW